MAGNACTCIYGVLSEFIGLFFFFFFLYMPEQIYANAFVTYYMWGPNQTFMLFHYKNFELTKFCVFADTSPIVA